MKWPAKWITPLTPCGKRRVAAVIGWRGGAYYTRRCPPPIVTVELATAHQLTRYLPPPIPTAPSRALHNMSQGQEPIMLPQGWEARW